MFMINLFYLFLKIYQKILNIKIVVLTDDDAKNYLNMEIDPLSYYPGFGNNEMNLKTSIVDYNKYE